MKKYKEKYKTGMIFRSKKYPWADIIEYSDPIVHVFRKSKAPFSGKAVHTFPEPSAVNLLVLRWNIYPVFCQKFL